MCLQRNSKQHRNDCSLGSLKGNAKKHLTYEKSKIFKRCIFSGTLTTKQKPSSFQVNRPNQLHLLSEARTQYPHPEQIKCVSKTSVKPASRKMPHGHSCSFLRAKNHSYPQTNNKFSITYSLINKLQDQI